MWEFVFLVLCLCVLILVYLRLSLGTKRTSGDAVNSSAILQVTSTNNSYDPLGDVLSSLDDDLKRMGLTLNADMKGYMDGQ